MPQHLPDAGSSLPAPLRDIAGAAGQALLAAQLRLVTVESCTGGLVAAAITAHAGSSNWFERGLVTYGNEAKIELAGVAPDSLARHGAVSEQVAGEMATGGQGSQGGQGGQGGDLRRVAVAITGIAGPGGGAPDKPVGTVCFGWAGPRRWGLRTATRHFAGGREQVRVQSAIYALRQLVVLLQAPLEDGGNGENRESGAAQS